VFDSQGFNGFAVFSIIAEPQHSEIYSSPEHSPKSLGSARLLFLANKESIKPF
jgi:hypothetical protein